MNEEQLYKDIYELKRELGGLRAEVIRLQGEVEYLTQARSDAEHRKALVNDADKNDFVRRIRLEGMRKAKEALRQRETP